MDRNLTQHRGRPGTIWRRRRSMLVAVSSLLAALFCLCAVSVQAQGVVPVVVVEPAPTLYALAPILEPRDDSYWLRLANGDYVRGKLIDSPADADLAWQAEGFAGPFSVPRDAAQEILISSAAAPATPPGRYCFLLAHRTRLVGSLLSIDDRTVAIDVVGAGRLEIDRTALNRMYRCDSPTLVYVGPQGLDGWLMTGPKHGWKNDTGRLGTELPHSSLLRNFSDLPKACFEIDVSWKGPPDFSLAFGVDLKPGVIVDVLSDDTRYPKPPLGAFVCENWAHTLVIKRETAKDADFVVLDSDLRADGELHLQVFVDQTRGRMVVLSDTGKLLGEVNVPDGKDTKLPGGNAIWLTNIAGNLKLNSLRVSRWNGEDPQPSDAANQQKLERVDGSMVRGAVLSFDGERRQFAVDLGEDRRESIDEDQLQDIVLTAPAEDDNADLWCVIERQGLQYSGKIMKVDHDELWLECPGIREPIHLPLASVKNMSPMRQIAAGEISNLLPRLEMAGMVMRGSLIAPASDSPTCLAWQPTWSKAGAAFLPGVSGQIIYREPPPVVPNQPPGRGRQPVPPPQPVGLLTRIFGVAPGQNPPEKPGKYASVLHLRSGDNLRCTVTKIDERGVTLVTGSADATFVPNDQVMALELVVDTTAGTIMKSKHERLLMTPRTQRTSPPTHLIRSTTGDYLRGRLIAMDDLQLEMEIRLESKTIPRTAVARIIWLQPEAVPTKDAQTKDAPTKEAPAPLPELPAGQVHLQSLDRDGKRLTMVGESFADTTISGHNDILGPCRIDVSSIDRLYLGSAVEVAAAVLPFHQWKPRVAPNPIDTSDDDEEDLATSSPLIGKPAPEFAIELVGGNRFNWDDYRGKIVVLDFWASWCGPCMQTLPQVDAVAREFAPQGVCLVAVNLQEGRDQIKQTLDKLQLETTVALDTDGAVAKKYGATAIPQTVIIGRDGNVARVFVGGSARFDEQLRAALESAVTGKPEAAE